jgi:hypothetical protein
MRRVRDKDKDENEPDAVQELLVGLLGIRSYESQSISLKHKEFSKKS